MTAFNRFLKDDDNDNDERLSDLGAVHTHEDNDDSEDSGDDKHHEEDEDDEEELDDEDSDGKEGLLSYLFDRQFVKQHLVAILVAIIASAISCYHIQSDNGLSILMAQRSLHDRIPIKTKPVKRQVPLKPTEIHHHHEYRRTSNLLFCTLDDESSLASESPLQRIKRVLSMPMEEKEWNDNDTWNIDPNLQLFQFNFPKEYTDIVNDYYIADSTMDDTYENVLSSNSDMTDRPQFHCLLDATLANQHRSTVPTYGIAYVQPDIRSFYKEEINEKKASSLSVKSLLDTPNIDSVEDDISPASLTYTGFTAKFINLSTKPMNLYWDGKNKPKFRSRIEPFEAFSTVTTPGNSFYLAPVYDKDHAMERWTMTADEAVVFYDAIENDPEVLMRLTREEKKLYEMQRLNIKYGQDYLVKTQRSWLSMFPRPMQMHHMWDAEYIGQEHEVITDQSHFITLPSDRVGQSRIWRQLDYADYDDMVEKRNKALSEGGNKFLNLKEYRNDGPLKLTLKVISVAPRIFEIDGFLSDSEVSHLIDLARIYNVTETDLKGKKALKKNHGSTNAWIRREMSSIVDAIYHRTADMLKIDESLLRHRNEHEHTELNTHHSIAEALHLAQFVKDQGYIPRSDAVQTSVRNRYQPNRFATVMFFLNTVKEEWGGDTMFPLAVTADRHDGVRITPKKGKAILFYNMLPDGNVDDLSQHSSEFLQDGEKWLGSLFVWDPIID
jgi:prolyl 4-hydroxylase